MLLPAELLLTVLCASSITAASTVSASKADCQCGYYDGTTKNLFTESLIVYFNETTGLPILHFVQETFSHKYEKGFNTQFREGADPSNVEISKSLSATDGTLANNTSLNLHVSPVKDNHLVIGSSVRSSRRDIQYGSFTSLLRSPAAWAGGLDGGSALSMELKFNLSQRVGVNLQNTNMNNSAKVTMLANEEFPSPQFSVPYGNMTNGTFGNGTLSPWDYTEFRMDWTKEGVKFYIGGHLARTIKKSDYAARFSTPSPLYLRHWSNGNFYSSQGPPKNTTVANVGWLRGFFNSSSMSKDDHATFGKRCHISDACLVSDTTLRASTPYSEHEMVKWKQEKKPRPKRPVAIWIAVGCIALTSCLLLQPAGKKVVEKIHSAKKGQRSDHDKPAIQAPPATMSTLFDSRAATLAGSKNITPANRTRAPSLQSTTTLNDMRPPSAIATPYTRTTLSSLNNSRTDLINKKSNRTSQFQDDILPFRNSRSILESSEDSEEKNSTAWTSPEKPPAVHWPKTEDEITAFGAVHHNGPSTEKAENKVFFIDEVSSKHGSSTDSAKHLESKSTEKPIQSETTPAPASEEKVEQWKANLPTKSDPTPSTTQQPSKSLPQPNKRVDYLAGLLAVSSLLVTAIHFSLTFVIGTINASAYTHYYSETIARKFFNSFFLSILWIGPFLMTSTRFLVSSYLRTGDIPPMAEKTVCRTPRFLIPVIAMILLEYFLINAGATKWLEYLPSITWSSWPFTAGFTNFSNFLSEVLELAFVIPNATPMVTFNYCTGVLWTIPVQLQGSWLTLLAVIVIREIRTPWKRFSFYAFCILNHWYALSWGSYFYIGILLTDLDITYKYRPWLHARPLFYYPLLLTFLLLGIAGLGLNIITQWTHTTYATYEYGIHPDINSALPIAQAGHATYPEYFIPRLNGIAFALGFQAAVELSPVIQKILSNKLLVLVFPHIFTIYLLHGFIFWSLGALLCVQLSVHGIPYWANLCIVAVVCYATIAMCLPVLTPMVDKLGKSMTQDIWRSAREASVGRKPTLWPFERGFLLDRYVTEHEGDKVKDVKVDHIKDELKV